MYKSIIYFKEDLPMEIVEALRKIADKAFDNRDGKVTGKVTSPHCLVYEGEEEDAGCLQLGLSNSGECKYFLDCVLAWKWTDEEHPEKNRDILTELKQLMPAEPGQEITAEYRSEIHFKETVPEKTMQLLQNIADQAFDNYAGKVTGKRMTPHCLSYDGNESEYGCLQLGMLDLEENEDFMACVIAWNWIDEVYPEECSDILGIMRKQ